MINIMQVPQKLFRALRADIMSYDKNNVSEACVLAAHFFSSYKGVTVFRIGGKRSGAFGAIFLTRKNSDADTVRHEYGHILQLRRLGVLKYAICIFLPSWRRWGSDKYYEKPWEITADILGGARAGKHAADKIAAGQAYLEKRGNMRLIACIRANSDLKGKK